ncbi:putative major facilitator superfamily transporter [Gordonia hirsuta DSM 44140 = NBRC 16056]|uniref:Putative major facilitator superfamily transporter n=1 Tax=Gordonia hirsuta DSM 44140 = NBRC 16056 TaxID=1121927 RepID=L7LAI5_9ACTN|nr:MFS transporter [Gordonia hirsuta]GAC57028.1 putative major facilitator superfamily transporter [Gordonia hirsuta DSM 44140 = NBRC 16056]
MSRLRGWSAVALAVFTAAWGGNEFTPLLVMYRQTDHVSGVVVDALLFTYVLGIVPALLVGGPLSDRFGRRPLMLPAPLFAALGSALLAAGANSVPLLAIGRVCSGIAIGLAMAVGGSWIKELSDRDGAGVTAGARRAALSLTAGFGLGAGVAALLAQWAPWPNQLAYLINIAMSTVAFVLLLPIPETQTGTREGRLRDDLSIPSVRKPAFWLQVAPAAPWVFGTCAVAYAVIPALLTPHTDGWQIVFAGICCVVGLTAGFFVQTLGRRIDRPGSPRAMVVALVLVAVGMLLAAYSAQILTIPMGLIAAAVLGTGYGMTLISGLLATQRLAGPNDLAGLTAVFYGLTYLGFASPAILSWLHQSYGFGYPAMLTFGAVVALVGLVVVLLAPRRAPVAAPLGSGRFHEEDVLERAPASS